MNKIILAMLVTLSATSEVYAAGTPYIGAGLGIGGYNTESGYQANLFGGYGYTFRQKFYLGGELNLHVGNYGRYTTTYGLGVSLLPGLKLTESTMLYARLGIDSTYLPHINNAQFKPLANDKTQFKPLFGIGLQTALTKKIDIRAEFDTSSNSTGTYNLGLIYKFD